MLVEALYILRFLTKILKSYESKLFDIAKSTAEEYKKYHTLYIKIGFLIGLILFIMLI